MYFSRVKKQEIGKLIDRCQKTIHETDTCHLFFMRFSKDKVCRPSKTWLTKKDNKSHCSLCLNNRSQDGYTPVLLQFPKFPVMWIQAFFVFRFYKTTLRDAINGLLKLLVIQSWVKMTSSFDDFNYKREGNLKED